MIRSLTFFGLLAALPALAHSQDPAQQSESGQTANRKKVVVAVQQQSNQDDATANVNSATRLEIRDGKLIVTDGSGKTQEIDLSGANNVQISSQQTTENVDGNVETRATSKAIIIGPDGEKTEIVFDGPIQGGHLGAGNQPLRAMFMPRPPIAFQLEASDLPSHQSQLAVQAMQAFGKFFIGVHCQPVDATLCAQLGIDAGSGLVVAEVTPESPAAQSGIQQHDILLFAGETALSSTEALSRAVNEAGENEKPLTLTLLRAGKETRIEITPALREMARWNPGDPDQNMADLQLDMQRVGPGLLVDPMAEEQGQAMEDMRRAAEEFRAQMAVMRDQLEMSRQQMQRSDEMLQRQLEELQNLRQKMPQGDLKKEKSGEGDGDDESESGS